MPIQTPYVPDSYAGDGITNAFVVSFPFQLPTDLLVQRVLAATNAVTTLVLGTDYSVTPVQSPSQNSPANTGTVVTPAALPIGTNIIISRAVPLTQLTTWVPNDPNPSTATMNAVDKLTMICQDLESEIQNIQLAPQTGIVTTVVFSMAAVAASQDITVNTTAGLTVGANIQVSNVINTIYAQITAITDLVLTATTLAITSGVAGNTMPVGSPVQLASIPAGTATINVSDSVTSATQASEIHFSNGSSAAAATRSPVACYLVSTVGGDALVKGYLQTGVKLSEINNDTPIGLPTIPFFNTNATKFTLSANTGIGTVLQRRTPGANPNPIDFDFINAAVSVGAGTIIPSLLHTTNSPTDTYVLSYDLASTHFSWVPNTSAAVPGGGNTSQFLRGDTTWSNVFRLDVGFGGLVFAEGETAASVGYYLGAASPNGIPTGYSMNGVLGAVTTNGSAWSFSASGSHFALFGGLTIANGSSPNYQPLLIDAVGATELLQVGKQLVPSSTNTNGIIRANSLRTGTGPWQFAYTINAPATSITIDLANGAYQRLTGIANAVTITLADSTPAPTVGGWQFASQLTLEINSPGANVFTWPGTITWANGASAPTMSASGINVIRLIRRQGQTQWVGYVENPASTSYSDAQARTAVLNSTYLTNSGSIQWNIIAGTSAQPFIPAASISGSLLAPACINSTSLFASNVVPATAIANGTLPTAKLALPGGSTVYMDGNGNFSTPAGGGSGGIQAQNLGSTIVGGPFTTINLAANLTGQNDGGGVLSIYAAASGGSFSPAISYSWTATQTFNNALLTSQYVSVPMTSTASLNGNQPTDGNLSGLTVSMQGTDGAYSVIDTSYIVNSIPGRTLNAIKNAMDVRANINANGFWIGHTSFAQSRRINSSDASVDCLWFNAWSPMQQFSASADPNGIVHSWTLGGTRIGEVNYGNAWADFGLAENRGSLLPSRHCIGMEFFPDHLPGEIAVGYGTYPKYNAQWAIAIGFAAAGSDGYAPQNWVGMLVDQNGVSPGGYALRLWGSNGTFSTRIGGIGASAATNAPAAIIKMSGTAQTGIDFAGTAGDSTVLTATNTGNPMITMADDQSIKLGSIWLRGHAGALQYSTNGTAWSSVTLP